MKISKLKLKNIKCFKDIEISFEDDKGSIKNWSLFVGDNGYGKTTILRSMAVGLCDKEGASGLLLELHGEYLRRGEKEGTIEIDLKSDEDERFTIRTSIKVKGDSESVSQEVEPVGESSRGETRDADSDSVRERVFAAAYGAGRSITGTKSYEQYATVDAVYTLFNYEHPLQNPELVAFRIKIASEDEWEKLKNTLKKVLMLRDDVKISLERTGLYVKTSGVKESLNSMSDGYQSLTSAILDFLGWNLMYRKDEDFDLSNLSGICFIDELEQHLHPRWQRSIVKILSEQFPNVQFICSTHTPICALGLGDLEGGSWLFKTPIPDGYSDIDRFNLQEDFKGYRADQILTSGIFDLTDTRSISVESKLEAYRDIYLKEESQRSEKEKQKFQSIENELKNLPMWDHLEDWRQRKRLIELIEGRYEIKSNDQD